LLRREELRVEEAVLLAPLLFNFHTRYLDLNRVWGVCYIGRYTGDILPDSLQKAKIINWGSSSPWTSSLHGVWDQYFLNDPTGLFRLNYKIEL